MVLQSGEVVSDEFTEFVESCVREIMERTDGRVGLTLCCGEQEPAVYERWRKAGAHRYLLRIRNFTISFIRMTGLMISRRAGSVSAHCARWITRSVPES